MNEAHGRAWRDPRAVIAQWSDAADVGPALLEARARGGWWDALAEAGVTLIVTREYEHLVLAISATAKPRLSYLRLPHPSGVAFDPVGDALYIASTRNPNHVVAFGRLAGAANGGRLVPRRSWYLPGRSYLHDLAMVDGRLHANAVGQNAIVAFGDAGAEIVWWPACLDRDGRPFTERNVLQLNSIAAGPNLASSYFTASGERPGRYRPGQPHYPVDRRGVVFSGATREPVVRGLTRPHSARLWDGRLWLDDSGYGEVGVVAGGRFVMIARLPGWTRGLGFAGGLAFVGTSRVLSGFEQYAPGLDAARCICAVHAIDTKTGAVRGRLEFPHGNQIFSVEPVPAPWSDGFPFHRGTTREAATALFYDYATEA